MLIHHYKVGVSIISINIQKKAYMALVNAIHVVNHYLINLQNNHFNL